MGIRQIPSVVVAAIFLSGVSNISMASAAEHIEASVQLSRMTQVSASWNNTQWVASGNLNADLPSGAEIGRLNINSAGGNTVEIIQTDAILPGSDYFSFSKKNGSNPSYFFVNAMSDSGQNAGAIKDGVLKVSNSDSSPIIIVFKTAYQKRVAPGRYTAKFQVTAYSA